MQVRRSRVTRNGKTYEYIQLVESYRRESDGMPMHRVVANLGRADELPAENIEHALRAARAGKRVVPAEESKAPRVPRPTANLRYLDVAVLLELSRSLGLEHLLRGVLPRGDAEVDPASVVLALAIQRCTDPGSTLYASRWFPRTALPELLGISRAAFNNTRLHRVLRDLDQVTPELMRRLPEHYVAREGAFAAMFLDVSDASFVGRGPELARRAKAKAGYVRQKIGIALLCNELGFPLHWDVVAGSQHDSITMTSVLKTVAGSDWLAQAPVVMDRAMGKTAQIRDLVDLDVRYLTALTSPEYEAYSTKIPHLPLADLQPRAADDPADIEAAARAIQTAGMERVADNLFVVDLGVVERPLTDASSSLPESSAADLTIEAVRICREVTNSVASGRFSSYAVAGRSLGLGKGVTMKYRQLATLSEAIQLEILDGRAAGCALAALIAIARIRDLDEQRRAFDVLLSSRGGARPTRARKQKAVDCADAPAPASIRVRAVAYFNPERFVEVRVRAERDKLDVAGFVATLNEKVASPGSRAKPADMLSAVDRKLRERDLLGAFDVRVIEREVAGRKLCRVEAKLKGAEWERRRRYDGFSVLVAHPDLPHSAAELCQLYRAKDAVEKDFQTIKSVVEIEPVRHHTSAKVRAHVTLCMLALLLERHLNHLVEKRCTAEAALETLSTCHLNRYQGRGRDAAYVLTEIDAHQRRILRTLRLEHLADEDGLPQRISGS